MLPNLIGEEEMAQPTPAALSSSTPTEGNTLMTGSSNQASATSTTISP